MKVNFNIYKSKVLKKGLELAANNGALFAAGTSLVLSATARPLAIMATPKTDKDNKKAVLAKSIASTMTGFLLMLGVTLPMAKSIKKINKEPLKFLKDATINNLKEDNKPLEFSKKYQFATQLFKLGIGAAIAAPKAIITGSLIPPVIDKIENSSKSQNKEIKTQPKQQNNSVSFTGRMPTERIAKGIGKIIDKPSTQNFVDKFKDTNFVMHIMAITDSITTLTLAHRIKKNKNIKEDKKKNLIANSFISTGLCIATGYGIDKALNKPTNKFIKKFSEINKNSPKLEKYIEGIKIAKPTLIMGAIYYMAIPLISTFLSDKLAKDNTSNKKGITS